MLDFTSALYLGFWHPSRALRPWERLSAGVPPALAEVPSAARVARTLAALQGFGMAMVATSTLHVFWDLIPILADEGKMAIYLDEAAYPIARWGVERAMLHGVPVRSFPHHDAEALARAVRVARFRGQRPLVVTDGLCPGCGEIAPLGSYLEVARQLGGRVVVDDTQALGILGGGPEPAAPYGQGGGGSPRWHAAACPELVVAASLAKGFGAPVAALTAADDILQLFAARSQTRVHSSPPSAAALRAAEHALALNFRYGDGLRARLAQLVSRFRGRLAGLGLTASGGLFPVQTLAPARGLDPVTVHGLLLKHGIRAVLHKPRPGGDPRISFLITARHRFSDIDVAVDALADVAARSPEGTRARDRIHSRNRQVAGRANVGSGGVPHEGLYGGQGASRDTAALLRDGARGPAYCRGPVRVRWLRSWSTAEL